MEDWLPLKGAEIARGTEIEILFQPTHEHYRGQTRYSGVMSPPGTTNNVIRLDDGGAIRMWEVGGQYFYRPRYGVEANKVHQALLRMQTRMVYGSRHSDKKISVDREHLETVIGALLDDKYRLVFPA